MSLHRLPPPLPPFWQSSTHHMHIAHIYLLSTGLTSGPRFCSTTLCFSSAVRARCLEAISLVGVFRTMTSLVNTFSVIFAMLRHLASRASHPHRPRRLNRRPPRPRLVLVSTRVVVRLPLALRVAFTSASLVVLKIMGPRIAPAPRARRDSAERAPLSFLLILISFLPFLLLARALIFLLLLPLLTLPLISLYWIPYLRILRPLLFSLPPF